MKCVGIDPGVAAAAAVCYDGRRIVAARSWTTETAAGFTALVMRARQQAERIGEFVRENDPELLVIEGFEDTHREAARRFFTPILIGVLDAELAGDFRIEYQLPSVVKRRMRDYLTYWTQGRTLVPGDDRLTNEHLRDAALYAIYGSGVT